VSDIPYVKVQEQYMFVCVAIDLFSTKALSYGISDTIDAILTMNTFDETFKERGRSENNLFHSDQGVRLLHLPFAPMTLRFELLNRIPFQENLPLSIRWHNNLHYKIKCRNIYLCDLLKHFISFGQSISIKGTSKYIARGK